MKDRKTREEELLKRIDRGEIEPESLEVKQIAAKIVADHGGVNRIKGKIEARIPLSEKETENDRLDDPFKPSGHPEDGPRYEMDAYENSDFDPYPDPADEIRRGPRPR